MQKLILKKALKYVGLIKIAIWIKIFFSKNRINQIWISFSFYFFNHWITKFPNYRLRKIYLKHVLGIYIGKQTFIHMGCYFGAGKISIGNNTVIGRDCYLGGGTLTIKDNVSITAQTYIFCATHLKDSPTFESVRKDVTIENHAWIGARAMVLPGVSIGEGAILGAMSTASKSIPDFTVYAGCPAKEIGKRTESLTYTLQYFPFFQ